MFIKRKEYNDLIYKAKRLEEKAKKLEEKEEEVQQLKKLIKKVKKDKIEKIFKNFHWVVCCEDSYNCMIYNNGIWQENVKSFVAQQEDRNYLPELIIKK